MAKDVAAHHDRLDLLMDNAGSVKIARETTAEGLEWTFSIWLGSCPSSCAIALRSSREEHRPEVVQEPDPARSVISGSSG